MLNAENDKANVVEILKSDKALKASKEELFGLVFDLFKTSSGSATASQIEMCEDVLTQLISVVEEEAKRRISERLSHLEEAPRRVIQYLAFEPIQIAQPVLCRSPVLLDEDLLKVTELCGTQHLEAIAERKKVSLPVTNELIRLGNIDVWERLATNNGAQLGDRSISFLANRAKQSSKIQLGLIERPDLPQSLVARIVSDAGDELYSQLEKIGRRDLLAHIERAKAEAHTRVMSKAGVLDIEFENTYNSVLRHEKVRQLTQQDLLDAAKEQNFHRVCSIFSRLANLSLEEAVHWLSRREIDPAIVAFKALGFSEEVVVRLLSVGPWREMLNDDLRRRVLHAYQNLKPDVAQRIFAKRSNPAMRKSA